MLLVFLMKIFLSNYKETHAYYKKKSKNSGSLKKKVTIIYKLSSKKLLF